MLFAQVFAWAFPPALSRVHHPTRHVPLSAQLMRPLVAFGETRTVETCARKDPALRAKLDAAAPTHFATLLNLYSKLDDLIEDREAVLGRQHKTLEL
ncbi:hypothetical protein HWV62_20600 [Athelia sp. TMB]|nr:hypothetical protein HWV62_20600 [Athelia sp. TMB]